MLLPHLPVNPVQVQPCLPLAKPLEQEEWILTSAGTDSVISHVFIP